MDVCSSLTVIWGLHSMLNCVDRVVQSPVVFITTARWKLEPQVGVFGSASAAAVVRCRSCRLHAHGGGAVAPLLRQS